MTPDPLDSRVAAQLRGRSDAWRLGASSSAALGALLLAWALTVDYTKVSYGFFADGATYYSLAHSIASDWDFEFRREDLVRVWREYPSGPEGIFLKRGRDLDFFAPGGVITSRPDPDQARLFYGKAYIFPLAVSPFVWLFGTNGFLVFHAILMTLCYLCAYAYLAARSYPAAAMVFAGAFLFASIAPVYMVWLMPDFFNLAMVLFGYFFWCYKDVAGEGALYTSAPGRIRWFLGRRSDVIAAIFLGIATFSKPTSIFLIVPPLASAALRGQWVRGLKIGTVFGAVVAGLFAVNVAITGEMNYQGGDRRTCYSQPSGFPFQTEQSTFEKTCMDRATDAVPFEVLVSRDALLQVFPRNLAYFFIGRHHGFAVYFFPGVLAMFLFLWATRDRAVWQWLTLATALGSAVFLLLYMPFSYSGGGGPVGNRYFLGVYPLFLFLTPPLLTAGPGLVAVAIGGLFTTQVLLNPFYSSFHPGEHTKAGLFRMLPPELTMLNDLPVNQSQQRSRQPLGGDPPVQAYFLDDGAYNREPDAWFWVRGESRADVLLRAPVDPATGRPLRMPRMEVQFESGPKPNRVTIQTPAETRTVDLAAGVHQSTVVEMGPGVPYRPDPRFPTNYVFAIYIDSETGFIPLFEAGLRDTRFLGVRVRLVPQYDAPAAAEPRP
jgi:hypothetical protein